MNEIKLALKIAEMLEDLNAGRLKRSAGDFLSGMIQAYGIIMDEPNVDRAMKLALTSAQGWKDAQ